MLSFILREKKLSFSNRTVHLCITHVKETVLSRNDSSMTVRGCVTD